MRNARLCNRIYSLKRIRTTRYIIIAEEMLLSVINVIWRQTFLCKFHDETTLTSKYAKEEKEAEPLSA